MQSVVWNLVTNAADAMPEGGTVLLETSNEVLDEAACRALPNAAPGRYVVLSVSDTGCGMSEELTEQVFEPFFTTKAESGGTGFGLPAVYGVVRQSGGFIDVTTALGQGSTFRVALPAMEEAAAEPTSPQADATPVRRERREGTILLVDDDELVRALAADILSKGGYRVRAAANAGEAFLLFRKHGEDIDLLVADVIMPQMTGAELHDALREQRPSLRALFISGHPSTVAGTGSVLPESARLLPKPFDAQALLAAVDAALDALR
jgi:CheY-like chemotaxis protein